MSASGTRVLFVAFHYPPIAAAGTHRTLNFSRILARRGHRVGVLTTATFGGMTLDPDLARRIPAEVEVARAGHVDPFRLLARLRGERLGSSPPAGIMPVAGEAARVRSGFATALDYASRLVALPDRYVSWIAAGLPHGIALARRLGAEVIYSTAPPYSAHLLAYLLASVLDLPWVADLRDPWTLNPFHANPYPSLRRADAVLEGLVVRHARRVILNTEQAEARYREAYPGLDKFRTITNGIDPELLLQPPVPVEANGEVRLLHVGGIYGRRFPAGLLRALARLAGQDRGLYERLLVEQIGPGDEHARLLRAARELGVADRLVTRDPVAHVEAFRRCRAARGLLLLGPSGTLPEVQVPSKLYEYLAAGRPILALAKPDGAIASILRLSDAAYVLADPDDPAAIAAALRRFADGLSDGTSGGNGARDRLGYEHLTSLLQDELRKAVGAATGRG